MSHLKKNIQTVFFEPRPQNIILWLIHQFYDISSSDDVNIAPKYYWHQHTNARTRIANIRWDERLVLRFERITVVMSVIFQRNIHISTTGNIRKAVSELKEKQTLCCR